MDYYSILGIPKNATEEDIRKAYKKQSMQHHPDRGGNEETFKQVNESYQTLKDPHKRAMYDHQQTAGQGGFYYNTSNMGNDPFSDMFASMFGGQHRARPQNPDVRLRVKLELEEVLTGKKIIAAYRLRNGQEETVNLDIPAGVNHGDTMKFSNLGDNSIPGTRGNLFVEIHINHKPNWTRNYNDLKTTVKVNCLEMIVGTKISVNTLDGKNLELTIPKGTRNNTTFSVNGYGIPDVRSNQKGKLLITVEATIPNNLKAQQLQRIREILNDI